MIKETAFMLLLLCCVLSAAEEQWVVSSHGMNVPFNSWQAEGARPGTGGVLVLNGVRPRRITSKALNKNRQPLLSFFPAAYIPQRGS